MLTIRAAGARANDASQRSNARGPRYGRSVQLLSVTDPDELEVTSEITADSTSSTCTCSGTSAKGHLNTDLVDWHYYEPDLGEIPS